MNGSFQSNWFLIFLQFPYPRYQLMLNCWSEYADKRPTFPDLVREFDRMITMLSDKVNVIIIVRRRILPLKFSRNFNSSCQAVTLLRLLQRQHLYIIPTLVTLSHKICSVFYINNSLRLARKYAWIFVRGHYLFREANSFPRAQLEEICELRGTDNV